MIRKLLLISLLAAALGAGWEFWAKGRLESWKKEKITAMIETRLEGVEEKIKENLEEKVTALAGQVPALKPLARASSPPAAGATPEAKVTLEIHQHEIEAFLMGEEGIEHPKVVISKEGIVVEGTVKALKASLPLRLEAHPEIRGESKIALVPKSLSVSGKVLGAEEIAELMQGRALLIETNLKGVLLEEITLRQGTILLTGRLDPGAKKPS